MLGDISGRFMGVKEGGTGYMSKGTQNRIAGELTLTLSEYTPHTVIQTDGHVQSF